MQGLSPYLMGAWENSGGLGPHIRSPSKAWNRNKQQLGVKARMSTQLVRPPVCQACYDSFQGLRIWGAEQPP